MSKVVNSVKQIVEECDRMIELTKDTEYLDIKGIVVTLTEKKNELFELFDKSPDKLKEIECLKAEVESLAIRLEYYLSVRMNEYTERRKLRAYAHKLYNDTREACLIYAKERSGDKYGITAWGVKAQWALTLYNRANHIIFELDEEDERMIKDIIQSLSKGE